IALERRQPLRCPGIQVSYSTIHAGYSRIDPVNILPGFFDLTIEFVFGAVDPRVELIRRGLDLITREFSCGHARGRKAGGRGYQQNNQKSSHCNFPPPESPGMKQPALSFLSQQDYLSVKSGYVFQCMGVRQKLAGLWTCSKPSKRGS